MPGQNFECHCWFSFLRNLSIYIYIYDNLCYFSTWVKIFKLFLLSIDTFIKSNTEYRISISLSLFLSFFLNFSLQ